MTRKRDADADEKTQDAVSAQSQPAEEGAAIPAEAAEPRAIPSEEPGEASEADRLQQRVAELEDRLLRAAADFENYRKRQVRQLEEVSRSAADRVLSDLLDVVDNFQRALSHADNTGGDNYRRGIEMIYEQIKGLLARYDVQPMESLGQPFDPNLHDAVLRGPSDKYAEGTVAVEVSAGYKRGDRVLRHARVGVSTGKAADNKTQG